VLLLVDALLTTWAEISYRRHFREQFKFFRRADKLEPADFGFKEIHINETLSGGGTARPIYPGVHIDRRFEISSSSQDHERLLNPVASRYESTGGMTAMDKPTTKVIHDQAWLTARVQQGESVVVTGKPAQGKTYALFQVLRHLSGRVVVGLKSSAEEAPSDEAVRQCKGKSIVLFLDDLQYFANYPGGLRNTIDRISTLAKSCTLAAACRTGLELDKVRTSTDVGLDRVYSVIRHKAALKTVEIDELRQLAKARHPDQHYTDEQLRQFSSVGALLLPEYLDEMRTRFVNLDPPARQCLAAMRLLFEYGVTPVTEPRVTAVMKMCFEIPDPPVRAAVDTLLTNSFLRSARPQSYEPEEAFLTDSSVRDFLAASLGHGADKDWPEKLRSALWSINDSPGILGLGIALVERDRASEAIPLLARIIDDQQNAEEYRMKMVLATSLFVKGYAHHELNELPDAVGTWAELVTRFADAPETELRIQVARALVSKGIALGEKDKFTGAIEAFNKVITRFGDAPETELRELVARALVNKGVTLERMKQPTEAIKAYDEVVTRFGDAKETELRIQVATALVYKGITCHELNRRDEAIIALCKANQNRHLLDEHDQHLLDKAFQFGGLSPKDCPEETDSEQ
jgi:tetratricopeptide (TPR) repeat protein